ncbi:MAG TPA: FGGY family carbohydrate kinase [Balneolales bacterium]|nr:FGGY family carbohydrate kinase [Balneolales bacterium]
MYLLGYDIGSSSIKATLIDADSGNVEATIQSPDKEMAIQSLHSGWAEQDPEMWWEHVIVVTRRIIQETGADPELIAAIGISYQMHGLVVVDKNQHVLRPSIIWCDGRAVSIGEQALSELGEDYCLQHFLNSPGNFTASKLKWVKDNEPDVYSKIDKIMLPGDYIAMKLTGEVKTSESGLSEGIMWDYTQKGLAGSLLNHYGISEELIPEAVPNFSVQGQVSISAAEELGLSTKTKIAYRAGDQPNNALSLNVLEPGEAAATAGTSGVIYGIIDKPLYDPKSRVNTFIHVNHSDEHPRYGVLLCVNGTGIQNSWIKNQLLDKSGISYDDMNKLASQAPVGSDKLVVLPFGNGPERSLQNEDIGGHIRGLNFNRHNTAHLLRAAQEGIAFALNYGLKVMKEMGLTIETIRVGKTNMFLSPIFQDAFTNTTQAVVELYHTLGSQGAAIGAGLGAGIYKNRNQAFSGLEKVRTIEPDRDLAQQYADAYEYWEESLKTLITKH